MYNYQTSIGVSEGYLHHNRGLQNDIAQSQSTNKYVYIKQNFINPGHTGLKPVIPKVLVNPHFNKKVFVNPNFNIAKPIAPITAPKIHVNPNVQKLNVNVNVKESIKKIHVNPNVLRNISLTMNSTTESEKCAKEVIKPVNEKSCITCFTGNKMSPEVTNYVAVGDKPKTRRPSIRSKFKIIKSQVLEKSWEKINQEKRRTSVKTKYNIIKSTSFPKYAMNTINKFKVDRRKSRTFILPQKNKKYVYVNRFLSISDIARSSLLKHQNKLRKPGLVDISGILYKKSPNHLRRMFNPSNKVHNYKKIKENLICKSKFKLIKKSTNKPSVQAQNKLQRVLKVKKKISPGKLRKCNIPCPYYRKYGRCKGKDNGKCYRKHDPDQIALCTRFLQGACVDEKCPLSHNVSPEKMPTCKFYLEGSCSKDNCSYLHVRISPKADICKDFLEGFCRKASQCDKRHQFLCPDYERNGSCVKQRCSYPHGNLVRKYSVFIKNKFAKKSSDCNKKVKDFEISKETDKLIGKEVLNCENLTAKTSEIKNRYYVEQNILPHDKCKQAAHGDKQNFNDTNNSDPENRIRSRPKLGKLPSFIAFEEM